MAPVMPVPLRQLLSGVSGVRIRGNAEVPISSISVDSRRIEPAALFVCLHGAHDDGHRNAAPPVAPAASAVLAMRDIDVHTPDVYTPEGADASLPSIRVGLDATIAFVPNTL